MRTIIALILIAMTLQPSLAAPQFNRTLKVETEKKHKKVSSKKFIGVWDFVLDGRQVVLNVKNIIKTRDPSISTFVYDISLDGFLNDSDLLGFIINGKAFFNITFINGFSFIGVSLNSKVNRGLYADLFIEDSLCDPTNLFDANTGLPILACIFGTATVSSLNSGSMTKR